MKRVSTYMPNDDMQYHLRRKEFMLNSIQGKIAKQSRIQNLRDDPVAASQSVMFKSHLSRLNQFMENAASVQDRGRVAEGYIQEALDIMHRVNEIAVQGANGTYTKQDTAIMAVEVNQLLNEMIELANARTSGGAAVFSGNKSFSNAFKAIKGHVDGSGEQVVTSVSYSGSESRNSIEVSENSHVESGFSGNSVFWAEQQVVISSRNAGNYFVPEDSSAMIDSVKVDFKAGDNIHAVIAKINDSGAPVKASLDPVKNSLVLSTTNPHQITVEDLGTGTVLRDTGIVRDGRGLPPHNLAVDARVSGGSLFDMMIGLRDSLYTGNTDDIGSGAMKGLQNAITHLVAQTGKLGAEDQRLELVKQRLAYTIPEVTAMDSRVTDLDMAEAITELKMLEHTHQASLQTAARVLKPTLLDFLR